MSLRAKLDFELEKWHIRFNWHWELIEALFEPTRKPFMTMDGSKTGNEKREQRTEKGKIRTKQQSWKGKLILRTWRWRSKQKNKAKKYIFCLKIYFFVLVSFYLFIALCRDDQFAVSWFSSSYYSTDLGLQLGDPAPLIGLSLWTCWNFIFWNKTDKGENEVTDTARF